VQGPPGPAPPPWCFSHPHPHHGIRLEAARSTFGAGQVLDPWRASDTSPVWLYLSSDHIWSYLITTWLCFYSTVRCTIIYFLKLSWDIQVSPLSYPPQREGCKRPNDFPPKQASTPQRFSRRSAFYCNFWINTGRGAHRRDLALVFKSTVQYSTRMKLMWSSKDRETTWLAFGGILHILRTVLAHFLCFWASELHSFSRSVSSSTQCFVRMSILFVVWGLAQAMLARADAVEGLVVHAVAAPCGMAFSPGP